MFNEYRKRSLVKAISWRILASTATVLIVFAFTGNWVVSMGIGGVEVLVKIGLYFGHERLWSWIKWGYTRG